MKQNSLIKILFAAMILSVLTGSLLMAYESSMPVLVMIALSVLYTVFIVAIIAFDNKYLLNKTSLWMTNLEAPRPEYNNKLVEFAGLLHDFNLEVQKNLDATAIIAHDVNEIKEKIQTNYIGSISTRKFHDKTCRFAKQIKDKNKINFKFEREAKRQGFKTCKCLK